MWLRGQARPTAFPLCRSLTKETKSHHRTRSLSNKVHCPTTVEPHQTANKLPVHSNRKTHIKEPRLPRADASSPFQTPVALLLPSANPGVGKAFMVISWNRLLFSIWQQILTRGCDYTTAATPGQLPPAKLWDSATWSLFAGSDCGFLRPSLMLRPPGGTGAGQTQG